MAAEKEDQLPERWRFVVRRRDPRKAGIPCGWIVGFGTWSPVDGRVTVCRLDPPSVESSRSLDDYLRDLPPNLALVWTDLFDPAENSSPESRQNPRRHVS